MNPNSVRPRRLHVSALAAVANPSYTRLDTWNLLDDACRLTWRRSTSPGSTPHTTWLGRSG